MQWTNTYRNGDVFAIGSYNVNASGVTTPSFKGGFQYLWLDMWKGSADSLHRWNLNQAGEYIYDITGYETYSISSNFGSPHLHQGWVSGARDSLDCLLITDSIYTSFFSANSTTVITNKNVGANNWIASQIYNIKNMNDTSIIMCGTFNRVNATANNSTSGIIANGVANYNIAGGTWSTFLNGCDNSFAENIQPYKLGFIAIGPFTKMNNVDSTSHIAYWNGTAWASIGNLNGNARGIMAAGNNLYIGVFLQMPAV